MLFTFHNRNDNNIMCMRIWFTIHWFANRTWLAFPLRNDFSFFILCVCVQNYLPLFFPSQMKPFHHFTIWPENCILLSLNVVFFFRRGAGSVSFNSLFTNKAFNSFTRCNYQFKLLTVVISFSAMTFHQWNYYWRSARASKFHPKG